jgi:hypothetical protein
MHALAWVWIHANVRTGMRLIQPVPLVQTSVKRVAHRIYSAATTIGRALFLLFNPTV